MENNKINIAGVLFNPVLHEDVLENIGEFVEQNKSVYITTPNPEMVLNSVKNNEFKNILNRSALAVPDGIGILWASTYLNLPFSKSKIVRFFQVIKTLTLVLLKPDSCKKIIPARVSGSDLFVNIVDKSQTTGWRIFLLGANEGVAEKAIKKLYIKYPRANFVGSYAGTPNENDEDCICDRINNTKPDILFVAYGSSLQEFWISRNLKKLHSVNVAIGIGGTFDFASGETKRAPKIFQKLGLEWLWRLFLEPSRIKRIWNATFVFVRLICKTKVSANIYSRVQN